MIDILLPTYNGASYVGQQIDSLFAQTCKGWRLIIRDDGSSDDTPKVCQPYVASHPGKVVLIRDELGRLGTNGSYRELLRHSEAEYVMFCDQDDVWLPTKIAKTLNLMEGTQNEYGKSTPILAHSDSEVVDENLRVLAPSLLRFVHRAPRPRLSRLCMELPIYGHSMMINRPLKQIGGAIPEDFHSWDWWHPLVATVFGRTVFLNEALTLFRRHSRTVSSFRKHGLLGYAAKPLSDHQRRVHICFRQCEIFYDRFAGSLDDEQRGFFEGVSKIRAANWITRKKLVLRYRLFKTGWLKTAGVLLAA